MNIEEINPHHEVHVVEYKSERACVTPVAFKLYKDAEKYANSLNAKRETDLFGNRMKAYINCIWLY